MQRPSEQWLDPAPGALRPWEPATLVALLLAGLAARWPFRHAPLIRDEGELAQLGQAILQGATPYLEVYNQKPPVAHYGMAALQAIAGDELATLRVATALYGCLTTVVLWAVARRLFGRAAALWTAGAFAAVILLRTAVVHSASTEYFMLLFSALTLFFWYRGGSGTALAAGACAALASHTKQTGLVLAVFLASDVVWHALRGGAVRGRELAAAAAGFAVVSAGIAGWFAAQGALGEYWACAWVNNFSYVGIRQGGLEKTWALALVIPSRAAGPVVWLWALGAAGLLAVALRPSSPAHGLWILWVGSALAALLAGAPFSHYWHPIAVPVALGVGVAMAGCVAVLRGVPRAAALAVALACWVPTLHASAGRLLDPRATLDAAYGGLFPSRQAPEIARYLAERTEPDEPILVIGSQPEIYYYADRPPASRMVFSYPMSGPFRYAAPLREELLAVLRGEGRPRYVVFVGHPPSLATLPGDAERFAARVMPTVREHYEIEARIPEGGTGPDVSIHRRKDVP